MTAISWVGTEGERRGRGKPKDAWEGALNRVPRVQLSVIAPPSTTINTNMSLRSYDPRSQKRKRQPSGSNDNGGGSGGRYPRPGSLEIGQSIAPAHGVPSQGQGLDAT